jgi:hypothetical protein
MAILKLNILKIFYVNVTYIQHDILTSVIGWWHKIKSTFLNLFAKKA